MKKLLLISGIILGSVSVACAQAADQAVPSQSRVAAPAKKLSVKEQNEQQAAATASKSAGSRSTTVAAKPAQKSFAAKKAKPVATGKKD